MRLGVAAQVGWTLPGHSAGIVIVTAGILLLIFSRFGGTGHRNVSPYGIQESVHGNIFINNLFGCGMGLATRCYSPLDRLDTASNSRAVQIRSKQISSIQKHEITQCRVRNKAGVWKGILSRAVQNPVQFGVWILDGRAGMSFFN